MIALHPTFHPNFVQFLKEFNDTHDYFECHELLEDYWKEVSQADKNHPLTAFILLSTSMYHWRRGNITGAIKTMNGSIKRFAETFPSSYYETINYVKLMQHATHSINIMKEKITFQRFAIELTNEELQHLVGALEIPSSSDLHFLTHKHMLRDRSEILIERERQKEMRKRLESGKKKRRDDLK
ncbi:DUF309 domain-containing protein [Psychrobacillus sp. NPDC096426]|uniref:DUF309 domain-containing protein n=1 Tax=Psychrobacillus sp. NPDC096426 TaxID=3364491 RepID=UPI00381EDDAF